MKCISYFLFSTSMVSFSISSEVRLDTHICEDSTHSIRYPKISPPVSFPRISDHIMFNEDVLLAGTNDASYGALGVSGMLLGLMGK